MKNKSMLIIILLIFLTIGVHAQTSAGYLSDLESELNFECEKELPLYMLLNCNESENIDSTKFVAGCELNFVKIYKILQNIMTTRDVECLPELKHLYNMQLDMFKVDWETHYLNNYYSCYPTQEYFNILKAFETTIFSISLIENNLSNEDIFMKYMDLKLLNKQIIKDIENRLSHIEAYPVFSEYYRHLRSKSWFASNIPFQYIDPFINELEPYFINMLIKTKFNSKQNVNYNLTTDCKYAYSKISNPEVGKILIKKYNYWKKHDQYHFIYKVALTGDNIELREFLMKKLITDKPVVSKYDVNFSKRYYLALSEGVYYRDVGMKVLLDNVDKQFRKGNAWCLELISDFPEEKLVNKLIDISSEQKLSTPEKKILERTLLLISKKEGLSFARTREIKETLLLLQSKNN